MQNLRAVLRLAKGRKEQTNAAILDSRTLQSTPESGNRTEYDGHKRKEGSKTHIAVDTLGHLLTLYLTSANEQDCSQVEEMACQVQTVTEQVEEIAFVDQEYTSDEPAKAAQQEGIELQVIKLPGAKKGFVLLPPSLGSRALVWLGFAFPPAGARL